MADDQAWFWTPEWQEGEREADEHIAAGRLDYFGSTEEFLAALTSENTAASIQKRQVRGES